MAQEIYFILPGPGEPYGGPFPDPELPGTEEEDYAMDGGDEALEDAGEEQKEREEDAEMEQMGEVPEEQDAGEAPIGEKNVLLNDETRLRLRQVAVMIRKWNGDDTEKEAMGLMESEKFTEGLTLMEKSLIWDVQRISKC